jgi:hypothetical protein
MNIKTIPITNSAIGPIKRVFIFYHLPFVMHYVLFTFFPFIP